MPRGIYIRTEESKAKMRLAGKNKVFTKEHRASLSKAGMGKRNALGYHHSEEAKAKMSLAGKKKVFTDEHKANLSLALRRYHHTENQPQYSKLHSKFLSEEHRAKMREAASKSMKGKHHTEEAKAKTSVTMKEVWQSPDFRDRVVRATLLASRIVPNQAEKYLLNLLESAYPNEWAFVGDGQLIIAGKNPDFANINGRKQLIELFGDYWHKGENPQDRIEIFRHYGYDTLVIWERELEDIEALLPKIDNFVRARRS